MINYSILAIQSLVPNCQFVWGFPYNYEEINWLDDRPIPTKKNWQTEKDKLIAYQPKQDCKNKAKQLIFNCDWSVLPDVKIYNKAEFESYRAILRDYILNPVENPEFPSEPIPKWIFTTKTMGDNNG